MDWNPAARAMPFARARYATDAAFGCSPVTRRRWRKPRATRIRASLAISPEVRVRRVTSFSRLNPQYVHVLTHSFDR